MTQKQMAELTGFSQASISRYRAGDQRPRMAQAQTLAFCFPGTEPEQWIADPKGMTLAALEDRIVPRRRAA